MRHYTKDLAPSDTADGGGGGSEGGGEGGSDESDPKAAAAAAAKKKKEAAKQSKATPGAPVLDELLDFTSRCASRTSTAPVTRGAAREILSTRRARG